MSPKQSSRIAWGVFAASMVALVAAIVAWTAGTDDSLTPDIVLFPAAYLAFGAVGALIVSRHPTNRIGLLALVTGATGSVVGLFSEVGRLEQPVPGQDWAAWIATWGFPATLAPPMLLILLFPTGHLASGRWRIVAALISVGVLALAVGNAFTPRMFEFPARENPLGIAAFTGSPLESGGIGWLPLLAGGIAASVGLVPRLRHARGVEREQLKWMTLAAALHGLAWVVVALDLPGTAGELAKYAVFATLVLIPIAAGIAILRHRLYEIDIVIRRTVVYGAVVAILGGLYLALVLGLQAVLSPVTGGDTLPVALSTLAIAALFGPVRGRVRELVDRRFYRSRYDQQRTLEQFAGQLRGELELDAVEGLFVAVAARTVQPASVSVWVRGRAS